MGIILRIKSIFTGVTMALCFNSLYSQTSAPFSYDVIGKNHPHKVQTPPLLQTKVIYPPMPAASCSDLGAENGWGAWQATEGYKQYGAGSNPIFFAPGAPAAPRFNITTGTGVDPCTPGPTGPPLPVVAPGFGNASIQLGQPNTNGAPCSNTGPYPPPGIGAAGNGCSEKLVYPLTVTQQDTNFIYAFAIVIENPAGGHAYNEAPFAEIYILDQNGDTVPCSHKKYVADLNGGVGPGFYAAACAGSTFPGYPSNGMIVSYMPWTVEGINLSNYVGQNLTVVITNSDCALGGHFCYSYWDFLCTTLSASAPAYCVGQQVSLTAPSIPQVNYQYQWYQNGVPYTGSPSGTSQTITPIPQPGDTFTVQIIQPGGCNFYLSYVPQPSTIIPDFTYSGTCGQMTFTDISAVSPASQNNTVNQWNWQFPGGIPSSSTQQNPGIITYPPGTYSVTLTVTSSAGCSNTITHTITVGGFPTAAFTSTPPCLGSATLLSDGSVTSASDPIVSWNWSMPGGNPASSSVANPSTVYTTAGTHTVTLVITTQQGCKDTVVQQVLVYNPPLANFSGPISGCAPVCNNYTDLSVATDGSIVNWQWSFPGGMPSSSTAQNPQNICYNVPGSYGASLIVTSSYGCKDTALITPLVNVYAFPKADFCLVPDIAPATDPVFAFCDLWSNDVVQWSWDFGDGTQNTFQTDPVHSYSSSVSGNDFYSFNVCLNVVNQYGCRDSICKVVELLPEFTFYIPNCFTPNSDFINETFFGKSRGVKEYSIWLFDRWGNMIWDCHKSDKNTNWDNPGQEGLSSACKWNGKVEGGHYMMKEDGSQLVQEDVYVWKVKLTDVFDKKHSYIGHVSVVK